jgi:hypothetical protein
MNAEQYLQSLRDEISRVRDRHGVGVFRIGDKIPDDIATAVKSEYGNKPGYRLDMRKCAQCKHEWDIIIYINY